MRTLINGGCSMKITSVLEAINMIFERHGRANRLEMTSGRRTKAARR